MKKRNIKKEMMNLPMIHNVVFRNNGNVEIFSKGDVKENVFKYIYSNPGMEFYFNKLNFYNVANW
jgi:hypothetical protein